MSPEASPGAPGGRGRVAVARFSTRCIIIGVSSSSTTNMVIISSGVCIYIYIYIYVYMYIYFYHLEHSIANCFAERKTISKYIPWT